jgi:hypothetical protein
VRSRPRRRASAEDLARRRIDELLGKQRADEEERELWRMRGLYPREFEAAVEARRDVKGDEDAA